MVKRARKTRIRITKGRPGSWYENEVDKEYTTSEMIAGCFVCDEHTKTSAMVTRKRIVNPEDVVVLTKNKKRR